MGACLFIHGFTGSPHEIQPLADELRSQGFEVHTPTLAGHAGNRADMKRTAWQDWIAGVESIMQDLHQAGKTVHLVGFSMGALIAAYLAVNYPVRTLTLLSTPIYYVNKRQMIRTIRETIRHRIRDRKSSTRPHRYAIKIRITPIKAVLNFRQLVREVKPWLPQVRVPALILQGEKDDLVEPRSAWHIYHNISSREKNIQFFPESDHMICLGCDQAEINRIVGRFIRAYDNEA